MEKQNQEHKIEYKINDFSEHCHLWNIVPGGSGRGVVKLRKIVDSIQSAKYTNSYEKLPSFLIVGKENTGKNLVCDALVNSLALEDVRQCHGKYFENGIQSSLYFCDSVYDTAHIISHVENLGHAAESILWRYLHNGCCSYYNYATRKFDLEQYCYGMIVLTARDKTRISKPIADAVDYIIELEPYTIEQQKLIVHQQLKFCDIDYVGGEMILQEIVGQGFARIRFVIDFLKICITVMKAELLDCLDMHVVDKAKRLEGNTALGNPPVRQNKDLPF